MFLIEKLVKSAKEGDKAAMDDIIRKFKYFIIKQATRYRIPSYDFEDMMQHGNLSVIKAVKYYKTGDKKFTSYCTRSVINNFNALLKSQIKHAREVANEDLLSIQINDFKLEEEFISLEDCKRVVQALKTLELCEQKIIKEIYFNYKSSKEVAIELDIKYSKVTQIKKIALIKLKKHLE